MAEQLEKGHSRPVICCAGHGGTGRVVSGSADHSLRVWDVKSRRLLRELYTKSSGHTDWVTSVTFSTNGAVVSGGADAKICVWDVDAPRAKDLLGHKSSISKLIVDSHNVCMSSAYDGTLRIWDIGRCKELAVLGGEYRCGITDFAWSNSLAVSGGKDGKLVFWDINNCKAVCRVAAHSSLISHILLDGRGGASSYRVLSAGGGDAKQLAAFDLRKMSSPVNHLNIHKGGISWIWCGAWASPEQAEQPSTGAEEPSTGAEEPSTGAEEPSTGANSEEASGCSSGSSRAIGRQEAETSTVAVTTGADAVVKVWDMNAFFGAPSSVAPVATVGSRRPVVCGAGWPDGTICMSCGDGRVLRGQPTPPSTDGAQPSQPQPVCFDEVRVDPSRLFTVLETVPLPGRRYVAVGGGEDGNVSLLHL